MRINERTGEALKPARRGQIATAVASVVIVTAFAAYCLIERPDFEVALALGWAALLWLAALWAYPWFIRIEAAHDASLTPVEREEESDGKQW